MANIIILGAGMVGSAMALDLAKIHSVCSCDLSEINLQRLAERNPKIQTLLLDVSKPKELKSAIAPFDLVISAVPGFLGFNTLKEIINCGKNVVDISFFPENGLELDEFARKKGVTAIIDCGVAPGMDNLILGFHNEQMQLTDFECYVGGLPKIKKWPFNYKAPFSPIDVIEEYTRPARYVENGKLVIKPAMSDVEHRYFDQLGTLEAFNSDGLRSIVHTMSHIPNMKEKTLRFPGHIQQICALRDAGFLDQEPIEMNGKKISPLEFTCNILFKEWKLAEDEPEFTVMQVRLLGTEKDGVKKEIVYELYDEYDPETRTSSMARTTGYTATAAANMFLNGLFSEQGVFPPELVGKEAACFHFILNYLEERGILYHRSDKII
ncbi:MAG: saccharopine dehydrogenase [Bacteroidetes bacterium]|nr:MAG: saccharopine dehydrogenase [Bacteroidota bacterium]